MQPTSQKPPAKSVLDLAGDLVGCVDGPPDLATNPKHLDGYGQQVIKEVRARSSSTQAGSPRDSSGERKTTAG